MKTLRQRLYDGTLDVHTAVGIAAQVAGALQAAHEAGIVHRDVKPANVLICRPDTTAEAASPVPRIRVTDFGIAKALEQGGQLDLTRTGSMRGTAQYLAPQQVQGPPIDARTDVFALGVVLYELIAGRVPWQGDTDLATAVARVDTDPLPPGQVRADVPREVEAVVLRALARNPAERFQSAADLRAALLAADPGPDPITMTMPQVCDAPTFLQSERSWLVPSLVVLLVVGALIAGGVVLGRTGTARSLVDRARGTSSAAASSTTLEQPSKVVQHLTAAVYDPFGADGENDELLGNMLDGVDTGAVWRTECYDAELPKPGVGFILDAGTVTKLASLEIVSLKAGWKASIYLSDAPAIDQARTSLDGWGTAVAEVSADQPTVTVPLDGRAARSVLVWFTSVGGIAADDCFGARANSHRVDVAEARLTAV